MRCFYLSQWWNSCREPVCQRRSPGGAEGARDSRRRGQRARWLQLHVEGRKVCMPGRSKRLRGAPGGGREVGRAARLGREHRGPSTGRAPSPLPAHPTPSLCRASSAAAPVRSGRIRPSQAGPDSHPGPWASAFPLAWEKHPALPSSRGATRAGRTSREGRPPAATSRPGPSAPRSGARGRRSLRLPPGRAGAGGGCSGCSLEGLRLPRPKLPAAPGNFIRLLPRGASSPIR